MALDDTLIALLGDRSIKLLSDTPRATHWRISDVTVSFHKQDGTWMCHTCKVERATCAHVQRVRRYSIRRVKHGTAGH